MSVTPNIDAYNDPEWISEYEHLRLAAQAAMLAFMRHVGQPDALLGLSDGGVSIGEVRVHIFPSYTFPTN